MSKTYHYVKAWRSRSKALLLKMFGERCIVCGYNNCSSALEFHHKDPSKKDFSISSYDQLNWNKLVDEAKKCILVCCRCHREIHAGLVNIDNVEQRFYEVSKPSVETKSPCNNCGTLKPLRQKFCSLQCARNSRPTIVLWNSIDLKQLLLVDQIGFEAIGRLVGVSGTAVKKRAKKLGLI